MLIIPVLNLNGKTEEGAAQDTKRDLNSNTVTRKSL